MRPNDRASPSRVVENSGAPQPSIVSSSIATPVRSSTVARTAFCSGCAGSRYSDVDHPFWTHVPSIPACLPEQFWASGSVPWPSVRHWKAASASDGQSGVLRRSSTPRPASESRVCTTARWPPSPLWLAQTRASSARSTSRPSRSIATACNGLSEDRAQTVTDGSPSASRTDPSGASTTRCPRCTDSTSPPRSTRASGTAAVATSVTVTSRRRDGTDRCRRDAASTGRPQV